MIPDTATTIADRRQQWQRLPADQRIKRVHSTVADVIAYARLRKLYLRRRNRANDYLFIKD